MGGKRDFKGVWIPKEIWLSPELKATEKMLWSEINSLDNEFGCVANNEHFQRALNLKERQVREYIKRLKDLNMISVELNKVKNSRTIRIIGKWRRSPDETLNDIESWKKEIIDKYRVDNEEENN